MCLQQFIAGIGKFANFGIQPLENHFITEVGGGTLKFLCKQYLAAQRPTLGEKKVFGYF